MKKIMLLHTGGTISMAENELGTVAQQDEHPLADFASQLGIDAEVEESVIFNLPSPHMEPDHVLKLAEIINSSDADSFVITHGTDTMEETAYLLDLLANVDKPIVITGAMKSSNELGSDATANLASALLTASTDEAADFGVLVAMNGELHAAREVYKSSSINLAAFKSIYGPVGIMTKNGLMFTRRPDPIAKIPATTLDGRVFLLKAYEGMSGELLGAIRSIHPDGLVIEAFGQGNLPKTVMPELKKVLQEGYPVVIVSRSLESIVQPTYGYEGGGNDLKSLGAIQVSGLSGQKARLKLLAVLGMTKDREEIRVKMQQN